MITRRKLMSALVIPLLFPCLPAGAEPDWQFKNAPLRFKLKIAERPTPACAGCLVEIPDGGILPKPAPATIVTDAEGRQLKHAVMRYDVNDGMTLLFGPVEKEQWVYAYFGGGKIVPWTAESGLAPGVLIYSAADASMETARAIAHEPGAVTGLELGVLPLPGLNGNPREPPGPFSGYILCHLISKDPGRTWLSPMGSVPLQVQFDGKPLITMTESRKQGGAGQWVTMTADPHCLEMFFASDKNGSARVQTAWRLPGAAPEELSVRDGMREPDWAARPVRNDELAHCGKAEIVEVKRSDNSPVAVFDPRPQEYFWFGEQPVILYRLVARTADNPAGTVYSWSMAGDAEAGKGAELTWLFDGHREHRVRLEAASGRSVSRSARIFRAVCPRDKRSRLEDAKAAGRFLDTMLAMARTAPPGGNPLAFLSPGTQDLMLRLIEGGAESALLPFLFEERWKTVKGALPPAERRKLEDVYFAGMAPKKPEEALQWADRFAENDKSDNARRQEWELRRIETLMYYTDNVRQAQEKAMELSKSRSVFGARAAIRLGDMAFISDRFDQALMLYGQAQDRVRHSARAGDQETEGESGAYKPLSTAGPSRSRKEPKSAGEKNDEEKKDRGSPAGTILPIGPANDWRIGAIRETSVSETARSLIRQGYLPEARETLGDWELEFPMSKLSGDYIVVEAQLLIAKGDHGRADKTLGAYCRAVPASSFLAEAMEMRLKCMTALGSPEAEVRAFAEDMKKRFQYHPAGEAAERVLNSLGKQR